MTEYVVLVKTSDDDGWGQVGPDRVSASSPSAAIRSIVEKRTDSSNGAQFVAVPVRSWKPVTVKVETKTALKFS